jgi:hypothetical protein
MFIDNIKTIGSTDKATLLKKGGRKGGGSLGILSKDCRATER